MVLNVFTFIEEMQKNVDEPPPDEPAAIIAHAAAFRAFMETLSKPPVSPLGHIAGEEAFKVFAQGQSFPVIGPLAIQAAYMEYLKAMILDPAAVAVLAVAPAGPPPVVPGSLETYCGGIYTWVKTGTFTEVPAPPAPWI